MKIEDLESLKLAIDTGNIGYYHGDFTQAFVDVVDELLEIKASGEVRLEYKEDFEDAQLAAQQAMEEKTHIMDEYEGRKQVTVKEMDKRLEEVLEIVARII